MTQAIFPACRSVWTPFDTNIQCYTSFGVELTMLETIIEHGQHVEDGSLLRASTQQSLLHGLNLLDSKNDGDRDKTPADLAVRLQCATLLASEGPEVSSSSDASAAAVELNKEGGAAAGSGKPQREIDQHAPATADHPSRSVEPGAAPSVRWNLIDAYSQSREQPARVGVLCSLTTPSTKPAAEPRRPKLLVDTAGAKGHPQTQMSNRQHAQRTTSPQLPALGSPPSVLRSSRRPDWQSGGPSQVPPTRRAAANRAQPFEEDNLEQVGALLNHDTT